MSTSQIPYTLIEEQPTSLIQNQSPQGNPITQQYGNKQGKGHATTKPTAPHKTPSTGQYDWVYTLLQVYACISTIFCIPLGVTAFVAADRASKNYQGGFRKKAMSISSGIIFCNPHCRCCHIAELWGFLVETGFE